MDPRSFCGLIAHQVQSQFRRIFSSKSLKATGEFFSRMLSGSKKALSEAAESRARPRTLRYEMCEQRLVLDGYPFAPGGGDGEGFEENVEIPVWVDGNFEFGDVNAQFPYGKENTFKLESNPSATKTIYLDFDGHHSQNNWWGHNIVFPAFDRNGDASVFTDAELSEIQKQFLHVVEDFLPFDVNVTTQDPGVEALRRSGAGDDRWGVRAVNTQYTNGFGNGTGGIAHLNSFAAGVDDPVFTFNKGANVGGMTNSHEVGHALGLRHDGLGSRTYHPGVGSGPTGWGPIMGAPFRKNLVQWSIGDYPDSTNTEDDLNIITKPQNGFGFRADDHGNERNTSTFLDVEDVTNVSGWGIIERNTDLDFFSFASGPGDISIQIDALANNASLDVEAKLYNAAGQLLATSNPADELNASFDLSVSGGSYFISVDGTGKPGVYSDYGSLGYYEISGVIVDPVNDRPTLNEIEDRILEEDAPKQVVPLTGITAGPNEFQPLKVTATSTNTDLIPNPEVNYSSPDSNGDLRFQPVPDRNGVSTIYVTVEDGGYDMDLDTKEDNASFTRSFQVIVNPVNDPPTLDEIDDILLNEDADEQTVDLKGITDGDEGFQPLAVTVSSTNTDLIPNPSVEYNSPSSSGKLKFQPVADQSGASVIFVTVEDGGDDNDLATKDDNLTFTQSFVVRVNPVNDDPTISSIPNQTMDEDESRTLMLNGISAGGGETQPLKVWATSSNISLMANPMVDYLSDEATGELHLMPEANATGTTVITVYVQDGGLDQSLDTTSDNSTISTTFVVEVESVNDVPTLNPLGDRTLDEDAGEQEVSLTGISAGGNENQPLQVTATSSNTALISNQSVDYSSPNVGGLLKFSTNPDRFGSSTIIVTVEDGGFDGDLSTKDDNATFSQSFVVTVEPQNDAPRFNVPTEVSADISKGISEVRMTGIDSGPFENQPVRFHVSTDNPGFLTNLQVDYTDPERTGKITFDTLGQLGQAEITVTLEDGGLDNNLLTPDDNAMTTKVIDFSITMKSVFYADTDMTTFGLVEGTYGSTYWANGSEQKITETGFAHGDRSRLEHRWRIENVAAQVSMEFLVWAGHDSSNEQFMFQYKVDGTETWKDLLTTTQNGNRKYHARVVDQDLADGGSIWVRVRDTYRGRDDQELASLTVKRLYVLSRGISEVQQSVNAFVFDGNAGEQGNNKAQIRFQLADRTRLTEDLDVYYEVGGTTSDGDYREVLSGKRTIRAGNFMTRLIVTPKDDRWMEGNESLTIKVLPTPEYRISGSPMSTIVFRDNDHTTYEANAEVSYLGSHRVNYSQSRFGDSFNEVISEKLYGNRTMMNHQWRFDIAGETRFIARGSFDVASNPYVDDFALSYSTDQQNWKPLGQIKYGDSLVLNREINVDPGTQTIWIRLSDRYRGAHDTHVARVVVDYLQLIKLDAVGPAMRTASLPMESETGLLAKQFVPSDDSLNSLAAAKLGSELTGAPDFNLDDEPDNDDDLPGFYECIEKDEFNLAIMYWNE